MITKTPKPPYYAVIFTSELSEDIEGYNEMAQKMLDLVKEQEGFLGSESCRSGTGITISYWKDMESINKWKENAKHTVAKKMGITRWYSHFFTRIACVEKDY